MVDYVAELTQTEAPLLTQVATYLCSQGLVLQDQRVQTPSLALDLVMREKDTLIFVEVCYRSHLHSTLASDWMRPSKAALLAKAAEHYLTRRRSPESPHRFDLVVLSGPMDAPKTIKWIQRII